MAAIIESAQHQLLKPQAMKKIKLTERGHQALRRFKVKYGLPPYASGHDCVLAYADYNAAKVNSLDADETRVIMMLMAMELERVAPQ